MVVGGWIGGGDDGGIGGGVCVSIWIVYVNCIGGGVED